MRSWLDANPDAIAWCMVGAWCAAVVLTMVFADQLEYAIHHGWHPAPRG